MAAVVTVIGDKEVIARMKALPEKLFKKMERQGLRSGAKIVEQACKANVPKDTGAWLSSIKVRAGKRRKGQISVVVGSAEGWFKGDQFYAGFVEFGHKIGKRPSRKRSFWTGKRPVDNRKEVPGKHPMEKAYDATKQDALGMVEASVMASLEEVVNGA